MSRQKQLQSYSRQITRLSHHIQKLNAQSDAIGNWRLLLAVAGGVPLITLIFLPYPILFGILLGATGLGFGLLIARHRRVHNTLNKMTIWHRIKQEMRARMLLDWKHIPDTEYRQTQHPLEVELDLRDLHRLLNTASTDSGAMRLRSWLINDDPQYRIIEHRQRLVNELAGNPAFRDKLTLHARLSRQDRHQPMNTAWITRWLDADVNLAWVDLWLVVLVVLAVANVIAFVLVQAGLTTPTISGIIWGLYALIYISRIGLIGQLGSDGHQLGDILRRLKAVMSYLEAYPYKEMPYVRQLCAPIITAKPSEHLRKLVMALGAASLRGNPPLWILLNALMPWDLYFLRRLHQQKQEIAGKLPRWLDIWYELEALNSLATFADLNPHTTMPVINTQNVLDAKQIGHPLLSHEKRVCNDFAFQSVGELAILTGSNMSGKSSFLRTLGVNLAMAYAGGVVVADSFEVGVFRLFSCIRVTDSIDDGISYFYAEVKRLRALLDALQADDERPLFFVIDEIFRGTNNRERLIGSRAYIDALVGANGLGLIATHDLELTKLAKGNPLIRNLHFRETIHDGRMIFDYQLHDGGSPTTNALQIMAMEGLPVGSATSQNLSNTKSSQSGKA